ARFHGANSWQPRELYPLSMRIHKYPASATSAAFSFDFRESERTWIYVYVLPGGHPMSEPVTYDLAAALPHVAAGVARGTPWAVAAAPFGVPAEVARNLPFTHQRQWQVAYRYAARLAAHEAFAEAQVHLRRLLRGEDEKLILK